MKVRKLLIPAAVAFIVGCLVALALRAKTRPVVVPPPTIERAPVNEPVPADEPATTPDIPLKPLGEANPAIKPADPEDGAAGG